jgi:chromosome segregation ATPase
LTLNLTLGVLLVGAMILGLRLDRRLRALRESHLSFAKAVSELDQAALRTQAGLQELKATAEGVRADLAERIDHARALSDRLVKLGAEADAKAQALTKVQAGVTPLARAAALLRQASEPAEAEARPAPTVRSRALVDDELFENGLSALGGGRR